MTVNIFELSGMLERAPRFLESKTRKPWVALRVSVEETYVTGKGKKYTKNSYYDVSVFIPKLINVVKSMGLGKREYIKIEGKLSSKEHKLYLNAASIQRLPLFPED